MFINEGFLGRCVLTLGAALAITACGGGTSTGGVDAFSQTNPVAMHAGPLAAMASSTRRPAAAARSVDTSSFLNWAESAYPALFEAPQSNKTVDVWTYRYYQKTDVFLGVNTNGDVLGLVGRGSGAYESVPLGKMTDFACLVYPSDCAAPPPGTTLQEGPFVKGALPMALIGYGNLPSEFIIRKEIQETDGSFKSIGPYTTTRGVSGVISTPNFALGILDNGAHTEVPFHYITYNYLQQYGMPGNLVCDDGTFNSPSSGHGDGLKKGSVKGSATVNIVNSSNAEVGLTLTISGATGTVSGSLRALTNLGDLKPKGFNGQIGSVVDRSISQATIAIADGGNEGQDGYILVVYYEMMIPGDGPYAGVAAFSCK